METLLKGLDYLPMAVAVVDRDGTIQFVNKAWLEFSLANGYRGTDFVGINYFRLCTSVEGAEKEQAGSFAEGLGNVLDRSQSDFEMVYPCHAPDQQRWFKGIVSPFDDHTIIAHVDITAEYEPGAADATQLERSKRAHDIQTMLTTVFGYTELGKGLPNAVNSLVQSREYFHKIDKLTWRLHEEVRIILEGDGVGGEGTPAALRLVDLMKELCGDLATEAQRMNVTIELEIGREFRLWADEQAVWRIFNNLLANAVKYNQQGGSATVSAATNRAGGIEVTVSDTGIGMDPDAIDSIFTPYARLDGDATVQNRDGQGLGLAIVGDLTKRLGAVVSVESEPGKGSKFLVQFPSWRTIGVP